MTMEGPRELHLEKPMKVGTLKPYDLQKHSTVLTDQSIILLEGNHFSVYQIIGDDQSLLSEIEASEWQIIPLEGQIRVQGKLIKPGECGLCTAMQDVDLSKNVKSIIACGSKVSWLA